MHCTIWYHMYNLKNVKNTHWGVFFIFLNCTNGTKSPNASHMYFSFYAQVSLVSQCILELEEARHFCHVHLLCQDKTNFFNLSGVAYVKFLRCNWFPLKFKDSKSFCWCLRGFGDVSNSPKEIFRYDNFSDVFSFNLHNSWYSRVIFRLRKCNF